MTVKYAVRELSFLVTMGVMNLEKKKKNRSNGGTLPTEMKCWQDY